MTRFALLASAALLYAVPAFAQTAPAGGGGQSSSTPPESDIVVTARRLDAARASIQPALGATTYTLTDQAIQNLPGGDEQQLNQVLLQLPGVAQDSFGQLHVRDDHGNLQYRINGTILPEGVASFGQTLTPRIVERFDLRTGALPAQYGLRTAGVIDITTKSGRQVSGGSVGVYGGSHDTIQPSFDLGGSSGPTTYFVTGSYLHNNLGIEAVDSSRTPLHDQTDQYQAFGLVDHVLDNQNRVSLMAGYTDQRFQIPNPRGLHPDAGYNVGGRTDILSDDLDERQHQRTGFVIASLLHDAGPLTLQGSVFGRYSSIDYYPDVTGELLFNGQAQRAAKQDFTAGVQLDATLRASAHHTIRFGLLGSRDRGISNTTSSVFPVDDGGNQTGQPISIVDNSRATEWTVSAYLQDEWQPLTDITINFGARFDRYDGFRAEQQLSPRVNLVWTPTATTTLHVGYARYFSPASFANIATETVARFVGTSGAAPNGLEATPAFAERMNYYDIGLEQKIGRAVSIGIDAYHRQSRNLVDEGQFGAPVILTPFNYAKGHIDGIEGNINYTQGRLLLYGNAAWAKAKATQIVSGQFNFDPDDLAYIANHYIYLDHDQTWTGSAGASYRIGADTRLGTTLVYGSGLRRDGAVPNGGKLPAYATVNLSLTHSFKRPGIDVRADIINVGDKIYEIRDGTGIGVGAPQYGARRGFFFGISKRL